MCKSNSGLSCNFSGSASFKPRQIFDLTNFQKLKIWLFVCNKQKPPIIHYYSYTRPIKIIGNIQKTINKTINN